MKYEAQNRNELGNPLRMEDFILEGCNFKQGAQPHFYSIDVMLKIFNLGKVYQNKLFSF